MAKSVQPVRHQTKSPPPWPWHPPPSPLSLSHPRGTDDGPSHVDARYVSRRASSPSAVPNCVRLQNRRQKAGFGKRSFKTCQNTPGDHADHAGMPAITPPRMKATGALVPPWACGFCPRMSFSIAWSSLLCKVELGGRIRVALSCSCSARQQISAPSKSAPPVPGIYSWPETNPEYWRDRLSCLVHISIAARPGARQGPDLAQPPKSLQRRCLSSPRAAPHAHNRRHSEPDPKTSRRSVRQIIAALSS